MLLPYVVTMFIGATVYLTYQHFTQSQAPDNLIYTTVTRAVEEQTYLSKLVLHKYYTHAIWLNSFYEDIRDNSFIKGIESALHPATQTQNKKSQNGTLKAKKSKRVGRKEMLTYKRYISSFFKALCTTITKKKIRIDNDKDLSSKNGAKTQIPKLKMPHMKSYEEYVSLSFCSSLKNAYDDKNIVFKSAILLSSLKTYFDTLENNDQFATHIVQDKIRDTLLRFKDLKLSKSDDTLRLLSETYSIAATKDEKDVIASHETNLKLDGDKKCFNHHYIDITGILADLLLDYEINLGEENGEKIYQEELDILTRVCTILNTILLSKKNLGTNCKQKYTIIFDPYSLVQFLEYSRPESEAANGIILQRLDRIYEGMRIEYEKKHMKKGFAGKIEFLERLDLLKMKVNKHAVTKEIVTRLALPDFCKITEILDRIFETYNRKSFWGADNCSFIESLVAKIADASYDKSRYNPKLQKRLECYL